MKLGDFSGPKRNQQKYQLPNFFYDAYVVLCCFFFGEGWVRKIKTHLMFQMEVA